MWKVFDGGVVYFLLLFVDIGGCDYVVVVMGMMCVGFDFKMGVVFW